ncbi:23412_t:CDS:2 [Dentiscutata erythropus]|uniref:23412_t:CDS:1 n=1 Tax=Dentiscutata erythropus TaxID=1348616 RepID=A0A9N9HDM6_9GLOM|nr:23412_t:CDS:2 [Dentiscutata erythropus]
MSSLFVAFCFTKNVTGSDKYISGTAVYRATHNIDEFHEITFKGFTGNLDSLIVLFEENCILLFTGRYVYEDSEYVTLVQTVLLSYSEGDYVLTPEDLPNSSPLLIYSAPIVPNSYIPDNRGGQESFMLARSLYNEVTILSVIRYLKIRQSKLPHLIATDIEWTYVPGDSSPSTPSTTTKVSSQRELDTYLESIEEKYATLTSQVPQKRQKLNIRPSHTKPLNNKLTSLNFPEIISQF